MTDIRRGRVLAGDRNSEKGPNIQRKYGARPATVKTAGKSNSETHLATRAAGQVNENTIAHTGVSETRQADFLSRGTDIIGFSKDGKDSPVPRIAHSSSYKNSQETIKKYSGIVSGGVGGTGSFTVPGGGDTSRLAPEIYSPLFQIANLQLPRDRVTMNAWNRNFYDTHPLVHNCINLHATYPLGRINIRCAKKEAEDFFNSMVEELDLIGILQSIALEFWKMGEKISGNSLITMSDGTLKPITEVRVGDVVLTHTGNKKKVVDKFCKPTNTVVEDHLKIFKVYVSGCAEPLIISGKHPILSTNKGYFVCSTKSCVAKGMRVLPGRKSCSNCGKKASYNKIDPDFVFMDELGERDLVYSPFSMTEMDDDNFSKDFCYLVGQWLAEGSYCKAKRKNYTKLNGIKFCSYDKKYVDDILKPLITKLFGFSPNIYTSKSSGFVKGKDKFDVWYEAEYKDGPRIAKDFMNHCGQYSKEKVLSNTIMNLPIDKQVDILAGFIDGDGHIDKSNGHAIISTSSQNLANQFVLLLRRAGARPSVSKQGSAFRIKIIANEAFKLFNGRLRSFKNNELRQSKWSASHSALLKQWHMLTVRKIEDVTDSFNDKYMYDLEVEDDHSYIANGVAVHNCFPYAELDEKEGRWKSITIQNPDYIRVKKSVLGGDAIISLIPDAALKRLVTSNNPSDMKIREGISQEILHYVRKGQDIPLDNMNISHLKMSSSPYDTRGTSLMVSIYKDLMLYDKLRESKFAQADNLVNPITLVKVGGSAEGEYHPTENDLEHWRQTIEAAQYDKDFKIISHAGVSIERVGASGAIIDIANDMNFIIDNILFGLMTPKAILTQDGASFSSASVGLEVLRQRYEAFRNMISQWLKVKIFAPLSKIHGFYEYKNGEKHLIVPEVDWNQMVLFDMTDYINILQTLSQPGSQGEPPKVSKNTLFKSLGLDPDEEKRKVRQEMIEEVIALKEKAVIKSMSISALKAIKEDDEIVEPTEDPLPGVPGADMAAGGMGAGLGGGLGGPPLGGGGFGGGLGGDLGGGLGGDLGGGLGGDLGGGFGGGAPGGDLGGGAGGGI